LWPIQPALLAIAIGDKDFIVSPPNRKTDERARSNRTNGREGETKKTAEEGKTGIGVATKRPMLNGCEFFRRVCMRVDAKNAQPAK